MNLILLYRIYVYNCIEIEGIEPLDYEEWKNEREEAMK